jgi:vacuolar-type H+-ATPase subunit H
LYNKCITKFVKNDFLYKGGDNLAFEVVKQISDIEKEGEELVKSASIKALDIQKSSREEAEKVLEKAKFDAEQYYKEILSKYEVEGQEASRPVLEEGNSLKEKIMNTSQEVLDKTVNLIIERIVKSHGNS